MANNIILGIDPGTQITGWGVLIKEGNRFSAVSWSAIRTKPSDPMPERLYQIYEEICNTIEKYAPESVAVEGQFVHKNAQSALKIGMARAASLMAAARFNLPVSEYQPRRVKQAVTGRGGSDKEQVQKMIMQLLNLSSKPSFDAADALAIAFTHAQQRGSLCMNISKGR